MQLMAFPTPPSSNWNRERIWVPIFVGKFSLPKADKNPSVFARTTNLQTPQLNLLIPRISPEGKVIIERRVFSNYQRQQQLARQLQMSWKDVPFFLSLLTINKNESGVPSVRPLMGVMKETTTDYYILIMRGKALPSSSQLDFITYEIRRLQNSTLAPNQEIFNLELNEVHPSIKIASPGTSESSPYNFAHSDVFFAPFSHQMARIALLDSESLSISKKSLIKQQNFRDKIQRFVQSFEANNLLYTFLETNNFMTLLKTQGYDQTGVSTAPLARFSFVPGYLRGENVSPTVTRDGQDWRPAIYVDSSQITGQYVYTWVLQEDHRLLAPVKLSITFPDHCRGRNISPWSSGQGFAYTFLCVDKEKNWSFKFLPIEL